MSIRYGYDSFAIYDAETGKNKGRYISLSPSAAARKAANKLTKQDKFKNRSLFTLLLRKTSRGSRKEVYCFSVRVVKFDIPIVVSRGGVTVIYGQKVIVSRVDTSSAIGVNRVSSMSFGIWILFIMFIILL